jgi:serine phosphatase RsbU (regulator of sigma subunit)
MPEKRSRRSARSKVPAAARAAGARFFARLQQALNSLNAETDPSDLARRVVEVAIAQFAISGARLWRVTDGMPSVWQEAGELPPPDVQLPEQAVASGQVARARGAHVALSLGGNGRANLVLEACSTKPLTPDTRHLLELYGHFAGVALSSTERRHAVEELRSVVEATKQLNSTLDLGELINIILQIATRQTGAERGTVFLVDSKREEIWSLVGLGLGQQEIRLPTTKGIAGWVARHGETVNLRDAYQDSRFESDVDRRLGYRTRSLLCLPILNKDNEIIGVLQLLNQKSGVFTSADESFLRTLSDHVALALENAQLHRELLAKQRLERDLALARSIQSGLLPEHPPSIPGFELAVSHRPSQMVGGDYYDFVDLGEQNLLIVVADVEGKGVASALVMATLQATLRALVKHVHSLELIVSLVNDMILADTRGGKYMSMFVGLLDPLNHTLHYVNAGHVPPAVVHANDDLFLLREGGMVVGIFPGVPYERGFLRLEPGDIFVACTDGITEAMDVHENEYGLERLVQAVCRERHLPAEKIVEYVLAEVDQFSRGGPHEDDRVIIILKVL